MKYSIRILFYFFILFQYFSQSLAYDWPFANGQSQYQINSTFGECRGALNHFHNGIDIQAPTDRTPVYAIESGTAYRDNIGDAGINIGHYRYFHLTNFQVTDEREVEAGTLILRLNAALALAHIGEKKHSLKTLTKIWENSGYNTKISWHEGFKDINTYRAIDMLKKSANHKNPYTALDEAIVLAQLGYKKIAYEKMIAYLYYPGHEPDTFGFYIKNHVTKIAIYGLAYYVGTEYALSAIQNMNGNLSPDVQKFRERILKKYLST